MMKRNSRWIGWLGVVLLVVGLGAAMAQETAGTWHVASEKELKSFLPARATVEKEHIETEMRTASGIVDAQGRFVAGVVLITAGYSADGKYSHYFVTQAGLQVEGLALPAGEYVFGWERGEDSLNVHFYDAATGALKGSVQAKKLPSNAGVESFKIWPPQTKSLLQIGRFGLPYQVSK